MCGEHLQRHAADVGDAGSSPRVRGTRYSLYALLLTVGIIPACAGNTACARTRRSCTRDHPRVCGEHFRRLGHSDLPAGSSPRVRGTHGHKSAADGFRGIIPACAGNTRPPRRRRRSVRDHPRVCGEHLPRTVPGQPGRGSSPRVRGTRLAHGRPDAARGIIPACAGNTLKMVKPASMARDHPRVCGEHTMATQTLALDLGSSPRVRGTQTITVTAENGDGIIPACAGNTTCR